MTDRLIVPCTCGAGTLTYDPDNRLVTVEHAAGSPDHPTTARATVRLPETVQVVQAAPPRAPTAEQRQHARAALANVRVWAVPNLNISAEAWHSWLHALELALLDPS